MALCPLGPEEQSPGTRTQKIRKDHAVAEPARGAGWLQGLSVGGEVRQGAPALRDPGWGRGQALRVPCIKEAVAEGVDPL